MIFDKPVLFADTSFDLSPYDAWWLEKNGLYEFNAHERLGRKFGEEDIDRIHELIEDVIKGESYKSSRDEVRNERWVKRGEAAKNVVDYLINQQSCGENVWR